MSGAAGAEFSVALPPVCTITRVGGGETMTVDGFLSNPDGLGVVNSGGTKLYIGGVLHVGPGQAQGVYQGTFEVRVSYQ